MKKRHWLIRLGIVLGLILIFVIIFFIYVGNYYHAEEYSFQSDKVVMTEKDDVITLDAGSDKGFIFYPGAKVEYSAYLPLMAEIAEEGINVYICHMTFNFAFFSADAATDVIENNSSVTTWYIGGHSLGGVIAGQYASKHDTISGVVFLASYSTKEINQKALSLYGSLDGVLNTKNYEKDKSNLKNLEEHIIEGGNHGQFGNYGFQSKDNEATISKEEQWSITSGYVSSFIKNN